MNILNKVKGFIHHINEAIKVEVDIIELKKSAKVIGFPSTHVGNTRDQGYPIFVADTYVFAQTKTRGVPQAYAVSLINGIKEIYVNTEFTQLPEQVRDAIITHEVGHLVLGALYTAKERILADLGLSDKAFLAECAADDYAVSAGFDMYGALVLLRDQFKFRSKELDKRIARLTGDITNG